MDIWPPLHLVGITHRKADLELRERFARSPEEVMRLLEAGNRTGVVLSTCNRFEIYWWGESDWPDWFAAAAERGETRVPQGAVLGQSGIAAVRHLFSVAAGLDSQVLGEHEILGQVRRAWALSREAMASTRELDLIFAAAIAAGRRVRRETPLGTWHASIGSVAVDLVDARLGGLHGRHSVIIGAGEAARGVAAALAERGAGISVVARHRERAAVLVELFGGEIEPWERLDEVIRDTDVVFAATSAPQAFLAADRLRASRTGTVVVDLGVPRNVDPDARRIAGIVLLDLDDLHSSGKGSMLELGRGLETARLILDREASRLLEKLDRWSGTVRVPEPPRVRVDTAM